MYEAHFIWLNLIFFYCEAAGSPGLVRTVRIGIYFPVFTFIAPISHFHSAQYLRPCREQAEGLLRSSAARCDESQASRVSDSNDNDDDNDNNNNEKTNQWMRGRVALHKHECGVVWAGCEGDSWARSPGSSPSPTHTHPTPPCPPSLPAAGRSNPLTAAAAAGINKLCFVVYFKHKINVPDNWRWGGLEGLINWHVTACSVLLFVLTVCILQICHF